MFDASTPVPFGNLIIHRHVDVGERGTATGESVLGSIASDRLPVEDDGGGKDFVAKKRRTIALFCSRTCGLPLGIEGESTDRPSDDVRPTIRAILPVPTQ
jgi:hypothetical protein